MLSVMRVLAGIGIALAVLLPAAGCGGAFFPWPKGVPKPKADQDTTAYLVYVWNQGLGQLTVQDTRQSAVVHVFPGETGVLHLFRKGRHRLAYTIEGQTYVTAMDFIPTAGERCWGLLVTATPANDVVNPVPIECP